LSYIVQYSCCSHIGRTRKINQDNFICNGRYLHDQEQISIPMTGSVNCDTPALFGVFDGMGGEEHGEVASLLAAEHAGAYAFGDDPPGEMLAFCRSANDRICEYAANNGIASMGTTAAMLLFFGKEITLCNIGDSKVFRFADHALEQISVDHYAAAVHGRKPPLSQNLGIPESDLLIEPYLARGDCNSGDVYLLCSDGLTDMVGQAEITRILDREALHHAADRLLEQALTNGGKDNITIILCKVEREKRRLFGSFRMKEKGMESHGT
jgi:protein phosphatase